MRRNPWAWRSRSASGTPGRISSVARRAGERGTPSSMVTAFRTPSRSRKTARRVSKAVLTSAAARGHGRERRERPPATWLPARRKAVGSHDAAEHGGGHDTLTPTATQDQRPTGGQYR